MTVAPPSSDISSTLPGPLGLGIPDLESLYTKEELESRRILIELLVMSLTVSPIRQEAKQPLWRFMTSAMEDRVINAFIAQQAEEFDELCTDSARYDALDHVWSAIKDEEFAALDGVTAKDVFDARLSRKALETSLLALAGEMMDHESAEWLIPSIFPSSGQVLNQEKLASNTTKAAVELAERLAKGYEYPAESTADELILWYVTNESHLGFLEDAGIDQPVSRLSESLVKDWDFLELFDQGFDLEEQADRMEYMRMTITGPHGWFKKFR